MLGSTGAGVELEAGVEVRRPRGGARPGAGRKPQAPEAPRNHPVNLKLSRPEVERLEREARARGVALGRLAWELVVEGLERLERAPGA